MSSPVALLLTIVLLAATGAVVEGASGRALKQSVPGVACDPAACNAVARRNPAALKRLIKAGKTTCFCTCNARSLVSAAVFSGCTGCIDHLIAAPSSCSVTGLVTGTNTALHQAAGVCQVLAGGTRPGVARAADFLRDSSVQQLLERGADPNRVNRGNNTPLCIAAMQNNANCGDVVLSLVQSGADICKACGLRALKTPLELAVNDSVRNVLIQEGGANC